MNEALLTQTTLVLAPTQLRSIDRSRADSVNKIFLLTESKKCVEWWNSFVPVKMSDYFSSRKRYKCLFQSVIQIFRFSVDIRLTLELELEPWGLSTNHAVLEFQFTSILSGSGVERQNASCRRIWLSVRLKTTTLEPPPTSRIARTRRTHKQQ